MFLKFCFARHSASSSFSGMSILSILKMTGLVPSLQQAIIIRPALHNGAALERRVDITADSIPSLSTGFAVHQVVEVILGRGALEDELVTHIEERAWPGLGISQILFLVICKAFLIDHGNLAFVLLFAASTSRFPNA